MSREKTVFIVLLTTGLGAVTGALLNPFLAGVGAMFGLVFGALATDARWRKR